jgi:hypothetical protein
MKREKDPRRITEYTLAEHNSQLSQYQLLINTILPQINELSLIPDRPGFGKRAKKLDSNGNFQLGVGLNVPFRHRAFLLIYFNQKLNTAAISIEFNTDNNTVADSAVFKNGIYQNQGHIQAYGIEEISRALNYLQSSGKFELV